jgi:glyoxylase-like metal-dependent hydrolase (beta-lactamase superfamily II)
MRRGVVLGLLIGTGALSMSIAAYQQPAGRGGQQGPPTVTVEKLRDNLFMLRGGGGNTAVFVRSNGVTLVDTKNPGYGAPILAAVKQITSQPVTMIINTHTHGDHVSGNVEFPASVEVVTQLNTEANMKKMAPVTGFAAPATPEPSIFERNNGRGLPTRTFTDRLTIGSGADQVDLYYFGRGHTNGDAWVLFPALRFVHAGDVFAYNNQVPILDANNGGSGVEIADTHMKAHAALSKLADSIITGHSDVMTFDDLRAYSDFNRRFLETMRAAKKQGQTVEQAAAAWTPPAGFTAPQAARLQANIQAIYNELP